MRAEAAGLPLKPESVFLFGTVAELAAEYGEPPETSADVADARADESYDARQDDVTPDTEPQPLPAAERPTRNTVIESLGTYLPFKEVSTADLLAGCVNSEREGGRNLIHDSESGFDIVGIECPSYGQYADFVEVGGSRTL